MFRSIPLGRTAAAAAFATFLGLVLANGTIAYAAGKLTEITVSDSDGGDETDTFAPTAAKIFVNVDLEDVSAGTKLTSKWIAVDTNGVAPPNYLIDSADFITKPEMDSAVFSLSKPNNGFPVGSYRVEVYINGELAQSAKFTVKS
jgi:hypothetical protein